MSLSVYILPIIFFFLNKTRNQKEVLINGISGMLGNKPNLTVTIELIKAVTDSQAEVMISVNEKGVTGSTRKIPASDLSTFLNQPTQKQQLANVGVTGIAAYMTPTKAQLEDYLKNPPPGMQRCVVYLWGAPGFCLRTAAVLV